MPFTMMDDVMDADQEYAPRFCSQAFMWHSVIQHRFLDAAHFSDYSTQNRVHCGLLDDEVPTGVLRYSANAVAAAVEKEKSNCESSALAEISRSRCRTASLCRGFIIPPQRFKQFATSILKEVSSECEPVLPSFGLGALQHWLESELITALARGARVGKGDIAMGNIVLSGPDVRVAQGASPPIPAARRNKEDTSQMLRVAGCRRDIIEMGRTFQVSLDEQFFVDEAWFSEWIEENGAGMTEDAKAALFVYLEAEARALLGRALEIASHNEKHTFNLASVPAGTPLPINLGSDEVETPENLAKLLLDMAPGRATCVEAKAKGDALVHVGEGDVEAASAISKDIRWGTCIF